MNTGSIVILLLGVMWFITMMGLLGAIEHPIFRPFRMFAGLDIFLGGFIFSLAMTFMVLPLIL